MQKVHALSKSANRVSSYGKNAGKLLAFAVMALIGLSVITIREYTSQAYGGLDTPVSSTDSRFFRNPTGSYPGSEWGWTSYDNHKAELAKHDSKIVFYQYSAPNYGTYYKTAGLGNDWTKYNGSIMSSAVVHCPGAVESSHNSHLFASPSIYGMYDGPGHSWCAGNVDPLPGPEVGKGMPDVHEKTSLYKVLNTADTYTFSTNNWNSKLQALSANGGYVKCKYTASGPFADPSGGSAQHYHCLTSDGSREADVDAGSEDILIQAPPPPNYYFGVSTTQFAGTVEAKAGSRGVTKFNIQNSGNVDQTFNVSCSTTPVRTFELTGGQPSIAAGISKEVIVSVDVSTASPGTVQLSCSFSRTTAGAPSETPTVNTDSITVIAPVQTTTSSTPTGVCLLRSSSSSSVSVPSYSAADTGYGYAKRAKPGVNELAGLRTACTSADYDALKATYCASNTGSYQEQVATYTSSGTSSASGCYAGSCSEYKSCPTTTTTPAAITLSGTIFKNGQYIDPATGATRTCTSPNNWMKEGETSTGARSFHCMPNYTPAASDLPPTECNSGISGTLWVWQSSNSSFSTDHCGPAQTTTTTTTTNTNTCPSGQMWCTASDTTASGSSGYCSTSCATTTTTNNWVNHPWTFKDGGTESSYILNRTDSEYANYIGTVHAACLTINKNQFSWKSGAGNDSADNWRNFGIPDCSGTAAPTPTPTPTPITSPMLPVPWEQMRECGPNEMPGYNVQCRTPMYKWNLSDKKFEKCDSATNTTWVDVRNNPSAKYTNCESMNYDLENEWRRDRNLLHDPRVDGDWYMPPWDAAAEMFQYSPKTDKFEKCSAGGNVYTVAMNTNDYMAPCNPVPAKDEGWLLKKARAEYKMHQLWNTARVDRPIVPPVPVPPGEKPVPVPPVKPPEPIAPPVPEIPIAACKPYLNGLRQSLSSDKMFWKDVNRSLEQAPGFSSKETVQKLLAGAKQIIVDLEKALKGNKCDKETLGKVQAAQQSLHTDIFADLSSYLPDLRDYAEAGICRAELENKSDRLTELLKKVKDEKQKEDISGLIEEIDAQIEEFGAEHDFAYDAAYECRGFMQEIEPRIATVIRVSDERVNRVIDDVISKRLEPVIARLEAQIEERGKKLDDLLVKIAELNNAISEVSRAAAQVAERLTVSISSASRIENESVRSEIQSAKDRIMPLVKSLTEALPSCVRNTFSREAFASQIGDSVIFNWLPRNAEEIERRLAIMTAACTANNLAQEDIDAFMGNIAELSAQNAQDSYREGITFSADVPTHEWFYGAYQEAHDNGYVTQGRPAEDALAQDALLMIMRAAGIPDVAGSCALTAPGVRRVSPYAICAANRAFEKGLVLPSDMTTPVSRAKIAEWISRLISLPQAGSEAALGGYDDLGGTTGSQRAAISQMVINEIMVGDTDSAGVSHFRPYATLTRAALVVVLEKVGAAQNLQR